MSLDQLYFCRPTSAMSGYCCPVSGLYLCGSGAHPGQISVFKIKLSFVHIAFGPYVLKKTTPKYCCWNFNPFMRTAVPWCIKLWDLGGATAATRVITGGYTPVTVYILATAATNRRNVIVRPLSTVEYTSVASLFHCRQWSH